MNGKLAKEIRKEARRRYHNDIDLFIKTVMILPFWQRIHFCFDVIFKIGGTKKKEKKLKGGDKNETGKD